MSGAGGWVPLSQASFWVGLGLFCLRAQAKLTRDGGEHGITYLDVFSAQHPGSKVRPLQGVLSNTSPPPPSSSPPTILYSSSFGPGAPNLEFGDFLGYFSQGGTGGLFKVGNGKQVARPRAPGVLGAEGPSPPHSSTGTRTHWTMMSLLLSLLLSLLMR